MKYAKYYLFVGSIICVFWGCFGPPDLEQQKKNCLSKNKTFDSMKVLNYRTGNLETRIICK